MTEKLKRYPAYKDSGLPWLGRMPAHWGIVASKRLFTERKERALSEDEQLSATQSHGVILQKDYERLVGRKVVRIFQHLEKRRHVEKDDFVISMRSFQGGLERAWCRGAIRSSYVVLKAGADVHVAYFAHLFKSYPYIQALRATSQFIRDGQDLTFSNFCLVHLPIVPIDEQKAIADFLDEHDRQVRRFIRNKRRLIELLNEQKQAVIRRAVTCGLDASIRLKPSGIDWLGEVPVHWGVRRIKQVTEILRGKFTHRPRNDAAFYDGPYPFIQTGDVSRAVKFITAYSQTLNEKGYSVSKMFPRGTLVMTIAANIGDVAILAFDACFPDSVIGLVPHQWMNQDYLYAVLGSMKEELMKEAPVTAQGNLNVSRIGSRSIPVPPVAEQEQIAAAVEERTVCLNSAATRIRREIELIREYRIRLIADIVTGKMDVRHLVPEGVEPLPEDLEPLGEQEEFFEDDLQDVADLEPVEEVVDADD